jgi:hypothetical protein
LIPEFDDIIKSKIKLQKIAIGLQDSFGTIQTMFENLQKAKERETESTIPNTWLLIMAFQNLEAELCDLEVVKLLDKLEQGIPWNHIERIESTESSSSVAVMLREQLKTARKQDQAAIIQYQQKCLEQVINIQSPT